MSSFCSTCTVVMTHCMSPFDLTEGDFYSFTASEKASKFSGFYLRARLFPRPGNIFCVCLYYPVSSAWCWIYLEDLVSCFKTLKKPIFLKTGLEAVGLLTEASGLPYGHTHLPHLLSFLVLVSECLHVLAPAHSHIASVAAYSSPACAPRLRAISVLTSAAPVSCTPVALAFLSFCYCYVCPSVLTWLIRLAPLPFLCPQVTRNGSLSLSLQWGPFHLPTQVKMSRSKSAFHVRPDLLA